MLRRRVERSERGELVANRAPPLAPVVRSTQLLLMRGGASLYFSGVEGGLTHDLPRYLRCRALPTYSHHRSASPHPQPPRQSFARQGVTGTPPTTIHPSPPKSWPMSPTALAQRRHQIHQLSSSPLTDSISLTHAQRRARSRVDAKAGDGDLACRTMARSPERRIGNVERRRVLTTKG
jgi:hypothetical protein